MRILALFLPVLFAAAVIATTGKPAAFIGAPVAAAPAQAPAAPADASPTIIFTSAADAQALLAKAKAERKDGQVMVPERILLSLRTSPIWSTARSTARSRFTKKKRNWCT